MKLVITVFLATLLGCATAQADVWKWVDASGKTHYVDSMTAIYTWTDEDGKICYSDTPDHEDAIAVQLVWHSSGSLEDEQEDQGSGDLAYPGETEEERIEREEAEAYNCRRATEIYDSYVNAPRLYRTDDNGEREYLSRTELRKTIAEARQQKEELCP